jgi:WD40 repeat protein
MSPPVVAAAPTPEGIENAVTAIAFNRNGDQIVAGANDGSVRVWYLETGRAAELLPAIPPGVAPTEERKIKSVAFSPDGAMILSAGNDGTIRLWNAKSHQPIGVMTTSTADGSPNAKPYPVWSAAFSPDGQPIVSGSGGYDNSLQLWNVDTLAPDGPAMVGHNGYQLYSVGFSPDGKNIVSAGYDGTIRVWNAETRQQVEVLGADQNPVLSVAYSHNGKWIASGGVDGRVRVWDAERGFQPVGTPMAGHQNWVASIAFSPHDTRILSGSWDENLQLWPAPRKWIDVLCDKLSSNMSHKQWGEWVSTRIDYVEVCPGLPVAPDA